MAALHNSYSKIPSVQEIDSFLESKGQKYGKEVRNQIQSILSELRGDSEWLSHEDTTRETILMVIQERLRSNKQELITVLNGTGAIIHTNLGRSVFSEEVFQEVAKMATSYTNLEFSLETGKRGARLSNVANLLKTITGAEDAVIVNNNAAAVLLTLIAFAKGKEIVISRGELIEIGGSFRIPEIIAVSGATIREVGATNRTRVSDYENAITENTAMLLKAHTSNYQITGFTETVPASELVNLAREKEVILVEDLGSGALKSFTHPQLNTEPLVPQIIKDGIDIVTFSGDKLLGGPQAGIIVGKAAYLEKIRKHPLYRAMRCDKLTMLLLEKTLVMYSRNQQEKTIPTQRMLNESDIEVKQRAESVLIGLDPSIFTLVSCESTPGGGSLPGKAIPSWGIQIHLPGMSENDTLTQLRELTPPVIGRIQEGQVILDCRTILPHQISILRDILTQLNQ